MHILFWCASCKLHALLVIVISIAWPADARYLHALAHCLTGCVRSAGLQERPFSRRNRLSLPASLHWVSAMKGDSGHIHGLTYRVGRHMPGQQSVEAGNDWSF